MRAALYRATPAPVAEAAEPTSGATAADIVRQVASLVRALARDSELELADLDGIGIGVPGVVDGGALRLAPNLPSFDGVDLDRALAEEVGAGVVLGNDVNMATLGELHHGHGRGIDSFLFVAVGTGLGMGFVVDGGLVRGAHGAAGEIGTLPFEGGILEDAAGGAALVRALPGARSAVDVYAAAERGDDAARAAVSRHVAAVAYAIQLANALLDPGLVVLGGGIGDRPDFAARVRDALSAAGVDVRVERSALGTSAGVIGAAEAALRTRGEQARV